MFVLFEDFRTHFRFVFFFCRFWAQRKIDELLLFPDVKENEVVLKQLGQKYNLVTPNTSLIVLETLDQYLKYEIEPPLTLPEIHKQYETIMKKREKEKKTKDEEKIVVVLNMWKRRVAWWNEDPTSQETKASYIVHCTEYRQRYHTLLHSFSSLIHLKLSYEISFGINFSDLEFGCSGEEQTVTTEWVEYFNEIDRKKEFEEWERQKIQEEKEREERYRLY